MHSLHNTPAYKKTLGPGHVHPASTAEHLEIAVAGILWQRVLRMQHDGLHLSRSGSVKRTAFRHGEVLIVNVSRRYIVAQRCVQRYLHRAPSTGQPSQVKATSRCSAPAPLWTTLARLDVLPWSLWAGGPLPMFKSRPGLRSYRSASHETVLTRLSLTRRRRTSNCACG